MAARLSRKPNDVMRIAVQPETPASVIMKRFLYLKMFLAVTLLVNFILFHMKGNRSMRTFLPDGGVLSRIISAGLLRIERIPDMMVTSITRDTDTEMATMLITTGIGVSIGGMSYICMYAPYITRGNSVLPTKTPSHPPAMLALSA